MFKPFPTSATHQRIHKNTHTQSHRRTIRLSLWIAVVLCLFCTASQRVFAASPAQVANPTYQLGASTSSLAADWSTFSIGDGLASDSILSLAIDSNGLLLVGTNNGLNLLSSANEWQTLTDASVLSGNIVFDIAIDPNHPSRYWLATNQGATLLDTNAMPMDPEQYSWIGFREPDGLVNNALSTVAVDSAGNIWFGTNFIDNGGSETGYGLAMLDTAETPFDKADDQWHTYSTQNSNLPNNVIRDIAIDQNDGTVWVATKGGIAALDGDDWVRYTTRNGLASNNVRSLLSTEDGLWIGTGNGLSFLDHNGTPALKADDEWRTFTTSNSSLTHNAVKSLAVDHNGQLWIGTIERTNGGEVGRGLNVWDYNDTLSNAADDTWISFSTADGLSDNAVRSILPIFSSLEESTQTSHVWLGTKAGLTKLSYSTSPFALANTEWTNLYADARLPSNTVNAVVANQKAAWWGTDSGLAVQNFSHTPHAKGDDHWTILTIEDNLPSNQILSLAIGPQNRLWIGTALGLVILDDAGTPSLNGDDLQVTYTTADGLLSNTVSDIQFDSSGRAWIANGDFVNGGISVLDGGGNWQSKSDDIWTVFTSDNSGIPPSKVNALAHGVDGLLWVATNKGAVRIDHGDTPFDLSDDVTTHFDTENSPLAFDIVRDVAVDAQGNPWFGLVVGGINLMTSDGNWQSFTEADGLIFNSVSTLAFDQQNNLWIGTEGAGMSVLDFATTYTEKEDDQWTTISERTQLLSGTVRNVYIDELNQSWIATFGGGGSLYSTFSWNTVYLPNILNASITK